MANAKTIQVKLKTIADVSDAQSNLKQLQKALGQLKLPDALRANFTKIFADAEKYGTKAADALASGFKTKGEVAAYTKNMEGLCRTVDQLVKSMSKIDPSILEESFKNNIDPTKLEALNAQLKTLEQNLAALRTDKIEAINNAIHNAKTIAKSSADSWDKFKKAIEDGNFSEAKKALNSLNLGLARVEKTTGESSERSIAYRQSLDALKQIFIDLTSDGSQYNQVLQKIANINLEKGGLSAEAIQRAAQEYESTTKQAQNMTAELHKMSSASQQAAGGQQQLNSELEQFKSKITYFFGMNNAINLFKRAIRSAYETVKDLDKVMTETAVVTQFSVGDMWSQLPEYTQRANELGVSIHSAYEAATLYYQQGLRTNEVVAISTETLKMARIAGLDAATATDRMTNALRGFNMEMNATNAQNINDVYSKLAAITASDVDEISTAMTKVASLANNANMDFETTAAFLSQIIETTRESAETAGTALKTVIARFSEVKSLYNEGELTGKDSDGEEIDVNKVSQALRSAGINLNEYLTGMKGLDDIFIELSSKWDSLDQVQQRYIATMAAGSRQQSRFIALMSDYARTTELVQAANTASGASEEQFSKTLESLETKLNKLKNAWDEFLMGIAENEAIKTVVDALTNLIQLINQLTDDLSGGNGLLKVIATLGVSIGSLKLGKRLFESLFSSIGGNILSFARNLNSQIAGDIASTATANVYREPGMAIWNSFSTSISNIKTTGLRETIAEKLKGMFSTSFTPAELGIKGEDLIPFGQLDFSKVQMSDDLKKAFGSQVGAMGLSKENNAKIGGLIAQGDLQGANAELQKLGKTFTLTGDQATQMGINIKSASKRVQSIGMISAVAGAGLMILISKLESTQKISKPVANALKVIAIGLMAFPVILKTVQAAIQVFSKSATAAISSIPIIGWIAAAVTALGALIALFVSLGKENSMSAQMERAAQATEAAAQAAEAAKDAYDALLGDQNKYFQLQEALDNLTEGTLEWKQALAEANQQVLQLLNDYPELAAYLDRGDKGQLVITNEGWTALIEKSKAAIGATSAAVMNAQIAEMKLQRRNAEDVVSKAFKANNTEDAKEAMQSAYRANADLFKDTDVNKDGIQYSETLQKIADQYNTSVEDLYQLKDALGEWDVAMNKVNTSILSFARSALTAVASEETSNYKYGQQLIDAFARGMTGTDENGNPIDKAFDKAVNEEIDGLSGKDQAEMPSGNNSVSSDFTRLATEYNVSDRMGDDSIANLEILYAAMKNQKVQDIDETLRGDRDALAREIARMDQTKQLSQRMDKFRVNMEKLTNEQQLEIATLLSGNAKSLTLNQIGDLGTLENYVKSLYGNNTDETKQQMANDLGFNTWDELMSAQSKQYETMVKNAERDYQRIADVTGAALRDANGEYNQSIAQFSQGIANNLANQLETISQTSGQQAAKDYFNEFSDVVLSVSKDTQDTLGNYLSTVDWSSMSDAMDAMDFMRDLGVDQTLMIEYWETAAKGSNAYIRSLNEALSLQERLNTELGNISNIESNLLEGKGTFEDMQALINAGVDISEFRLGDQGWTANANDINKAIEALQEYNQAKIRLTIDQNQRAYDAVKDNKYDFAVQNADGTWRKADNWSADNARQNLIDLGYLSAEDADDINALNSAWDEYLKYLNQFDAVQVLLQKHLAYSEYKGMDTNEILESFTVDKADAAATALEAKALGANIGEQYIDGLVDTIRDENSSAEVRQAAAKQLAQLIDIYEQADKFGIDTTALEEYASTLTNLPTDKAFASALQDLNLNQGFSDLVNGFETWNQILSGADTTVEYRQTLIALGKMIGQMLNIDAIPASQINANVIALAQQAAQGNLDAIQALSGLFGGNLSSDYQYKINASTMQTITDRQYSNTYTELYNLNEKLNEQIRQREKLERKYQETLAKESSTLAEIRKSYDAQIDALEKEKDIQNNRSSTALGFISSLASRYSDVAQYANYQNGELYVDTTGLENLDEETGKRFEEYLKYLEQYSKEYEEAIDALDDIQDSIDDIRQQSIDSYISFEERVMDAYVTAKEKEIDALENATNALDDANSKLIAKIQQQINDQRQARDNAQAESDISDMESRLAYLRRDTSGANQLEIMQLEKELEQARQEYNDNRIDQAIQQMQDDADVAAEQRATQISVMRQQLAQAQETGELWKPVHQLITDAFTGGKMNPDSELVKLLQGKDSFESLSSAAQAQWLENITTALNTAAIGSRDVDSEYSGVSGINISITPITNKNTKRYASGGLVDSTGPAWLDGSKSNPEMVLSPIDTRNFMALRDVLAKLMNGNNLKGGGDAYYDIDINAEINSDYDVDKLVERIKKQITDSSAYRNVNTMNFIR